MSTALRAPNRVDAPPAFRCPSCSGLIVEGDETLDCVRCRRSFPIVAGLPDLRLESDRYLDLDGDRAKANRLARFAEQTDLAGLIEAYYEETADVDPRRRALYSAHVRRAESRGDAVAATLPVRGNILEIGCGSGGLLASLARSGREVVGVDIAMRWLVASRRRLADINKSATLVGASANRLPWPDASFDTVVADSVLEHLDDPADAIREWARVLRPGGTLRIWSPNRWSILPDPHVGLLGVGWLPRRWAPGFVRLLRGCDWPVRPIGAAEAGRLFDRGSWDSAAIGPAPIGASMLEGRWAEFAFSAYETIRRGRLSRPILRAVGPLWELRATRRPDR